MRYLKNKQLGPHNPPVHEGAAALDAQEDYLTVHGGAVALVALVYKTDQQAECPRGQWPWWRSFIGLANGLGGHV